MLKTLKDVEPLRLAGHEFVFGRCIRALGSGADARTCGRFLRDIVSYGQAEVGQTGIAHYGILNQAEAAEIEAYRLAERRQVCIASGWSILVLLFLGASAFAHDGVHDAWFDGLTVPGTAMLCCSRTDCKPVEARIRGDGRWEVWIDRVTFPDGFSPAEGHAPDAWVVVPEAAVLHGKENPTGAPIACWYQGVVRCFVPGVGT